MAPKKSKRGSASGSSTKKKAKPGLDGQKPKKKGEKAPSRKNKAWGKSKVKNKDDDGSSSAGGARSGLKPVRIKLDKEGRDVILDILHKLHVAGEGDGAEDGTDGSDEDDDDEDDDDEEEGSSSDEDSEDASDADVEVDDSDGGGDVEDFSGRQGHGDFEYDGSFGDMANLMSDLVVNEEALPAAANGKPASSSAGATSASKGSDERERAASAGPTKSSSGSRKSPPTTGAKTRQEQEQVSNPLLGGSSSSSSGRSASKGAARSNVTREKLLASMVQEDRKTSREAQKGVGAVPSAAIHAASTVGGGAVSGAAAARGYQRPDPPGAGKGNDKVRLEVCGENKKTGAPDLNAKKVRGSPVACLCVDESPAFL